MTSTILPTFQKKLVTLGNIKFIKICSMVLSLLYAHRETGRERERERERDKMKIAGTYFQLFIVIGNDKTQISLIIQLPPTYAISNKNVLTKKKARETLQ